MEIGPDGSLCRITSTAKHSANNVQIVKVLENELQNPSDPHYKLVFLGEEEDNSESSSESDDEAFKEFIALENSIKLRYSESTEKDNNRIQETTDESKPQDEKFTSEVFDKKYRSNNTSRYHHKFSPRNFNGKVTKPYNRKKPPSQDIDPWLIPPVLTYNQSQIYAQFPSAAEPSLTNSAQNEKTKPVGLLGDSPYSPHFPQHNFSRRNQSNNFPRHNYWDGDYPSQYQRPVQSMQGQANKKYHNKNRYWKNKDRSRSRWNGNHNEDQQNRNRRGNTERFERYRK